MSTFLQRFCADVVSVLAMTMSGERECLKYRLLGSQEELASWGHEYVRSDTAQKRYKKHSGMYFPLLTF